MLIHLSQVSGVGTRLGSPLPDCHYPHPNRRDNVPVCARRGDRAFVRINLNCICFIRNVQPSTHTRIAGTPYLYARGGVIAPPREEASYPFRPRHAVLPPSSFWFWGTLQAEGAQGTPTQSHISPSILVYEDNLYVSPSTLSYITKYASIRR